MGADREQWRIGRLRALLDHPDFGGSKAALGRALGYQDGSLVGQMLRGERPITEKTVDRIVTMSGGRYRGWFSEVPQVAAVEACGVTAHVVSCLAALSNQLRALAPSDQSIATAALAAWVQHGCPIESVPRLEALLGEFLTATADVAQKVGNGA